MESEVKAGILLVHKGSGLVKKIQKRYAALYKRSSHGNIRIELYDTKENFDKRVKGSKKHLISLEGCAKINKIPTNEGKKNEKGIQLSFNDNKEQEFNKEQNSNVSHYSRQIFQTESDEELENWFTSISNVIFGGNSSFMDNVIYEQYDDEGYVVTIKQNDVVNKLNLHGSYNLFVTTDDVELREKSNKQIAAKWPLQLLRKYGRDKQEFSLEAGRRCSTGPGMFYFITDHYNAIFQDVDSKVRNLAERGRAHSTSSTKAGISPTFSGNPPESPLLPPNSPLPMSPQPYAEQSVYDDPLDMRKNNPIIEESIYNEPVNTKPMRKQRPSVNRASSPKHLKPEKAHKAGNGKVAIASKHSGPAKPERKWQIKNQGGKKDKKSKNLPSSPLPPPPAIEDATYAEALPAGDMVQDISDYGQLNFDGTSGSRSSGDMENAYDSLNVDWAGGKPSNTASSSSEYATAADINQRFRGLSTEEESMYDKVKR